MAWSLWLICEFFLNLIMFATIENVGHGFLLFVKVISDEIFKVSVLTQKSLKCRSLHHCFGPFYVFHDQFPECHIRI